MSKQTVLLLIIFLGVSFGLVFSSGGSTVPFEKLMGQVGITVGIAPNPYNTLAEQLNQEQNRLDQESSTLAEREAALASSSAASNPLASPNESYLTIGVIFVAVLLIINFYWDWRRSRQASESAKEPI